jgi:hypothetical protein
MAASPCWISNKGDLSDHIRQKSDDLTRIKTYKNHKGELEFSPSPRRPLSGTFSLKEKRLMKFRMVISYPLTRKHSFSGGHVIEAGLPGRLKSDRVAERSNA